MQPRRDNLRKGEATRQSIVEHAAGLASQLGLLGLSIGRLSDDLGLSKSGLFAHFKSKEQLLIDVLDHAAARFVEHVVKPTVQAPRGEPRVRAAFEAWLRWPQKSGMVGGCFFVAASVELDDRPGPVRDHLVDMQRDWLRTLARTVDSAIDEGHFDKRTDPEQFAHELYGLMLACHHAARLLADPKAVSRTRTAFERLLAQAHPQHRANRP